MPGPDEIQTFAPGVDELEGTIVGFSDSGPQRDAYAIVEVVRRLSLVVPVEQLRYISVPNKELEG